MAVDDVVLDRRGRGPEPGPPSGPPPDRSAARIRHSPGLDGLRGIAVVLVVVFHVWPDVLPGGFLGVSLFFTLSGYLITSLLLAEHATTGRVALGSFWGRRFRRLMPAALVTLAAVLVLGQWLSAPADLPTQVAAATAYVYNWFQIAHGNGYGSMFADPSPLEHFWSLAIEEQFYVVFPLIAAGALSYGRRVLATVSGVLLAGSLATIVVTASNPEVSYLSTFTRAAELLAGVLLAFVWPLGTAGRRGSRPLTLAGLAAIAGLVLLSRVVHYPDWIVAHGLLPATAVVSCIAISFASTMRADRVLGHAVLVWLGQRSYAIYLIHWPVDVWLPAPGLVKVAVTFVLAELSWHLVESPVRLRTVLAAPRQAFGVAVGFVGVLLVACLVLSSTAGAGGSSSTTAPTVERSDPARSNEGPTDRTIVDDATSPGTLAAGAPITVWWIGDSQSDGLMDTLTGRRDAASLTIEGASPDTVAFSTQFGTHPATVVDLAAIACDGGEGTAKLRYTQGQVGTEQEMCPQWQARWQDALEGWGPPDVVLWAVGGSTTWLPRSFVGTAADDWKLPRDAEWQDWWRRTADARLAWLESALPTARILWLTPAVPNRDEYRDAVRPSSDEFAGIADDTAVVSRLQREIVSAHPGVRLVDFGRWKAAAGPDGTDLQGTLDGVHWDETTARDVVLPWFEAQVVGALTAN